MKIYEQGIYDDVPMADYVQDRLREEPTFSKGALKDAVMNSPAHAHFHHPRFGAHQSTGTKESDVGSFLHQLVLGGDDEVVWVDAKDWRKKESQEQKKAAREAGKIPLLTKQRQVIDDMVGNVRAVLSSFAPLVRERTMIYRDPVTGLWCRSRPDTTSEDSELVVELKSTANADPIKFCRSVLFSMWYDVQAVHAAEGLRECTGRAPKELVWVVVESAAPYGVSVVYADDTTIELGMKKRALGLSLWEKSLKHKQFPSYRTHGWAEPTTSAIWDYEQRLCAAEAIQWV